MKYIFCLILLSASSLGSYSQEVLHWRGPDRSGVYPEHGLMKSWPGEGPQLAWEFDGLGSGYGSPAITAGRIFVNGETDSLSYLVSLDLSGKFLWRSKIGKEWTQSYPGSRSTPTVMGDLVYVTAGLGQVACFEASTGKEKWSLNLVADFHGSLPRFGFSESLLVDGGTVYCSPGSRDTNVVALDRFTGKIRWICKGKGEATSYCSPMLIRLPARTLLVTYSITHLMGIDAANGTLLWSYKQEGQDVDCQVNTPLYEDGYLYGVAGNGNGAFKLRLSDDGSQVTEIWKNGRCDGLTGGFIKAGNYLYTSGYERRQYYSLELNGGTMVDSLKFDRGSVILADGMLYLYNEKGQFGLFRPDGPKLTQISLFKVTRGTKAHYSHPVICQGILYIRHGKSLLAYKIKE